MAKMVTCPDCGAEVGASGLRAHMGGATCTVAAAARKTQRLGLLRCGAGGAALRRLGVKTEEWATSFSPGGPGRRTKLHYGRYAPAWAVCAWELRDQHPEVPDLIRASAAAGAPVPELTAILVLHALAGGGQA